MFSSKRLLSLTALTTITLMATACSFEYFLEEEVAGPTVNVSPDQPSKSFVLKVCLPDDTVADLVEIEISPWSNDTEAHLVTVEDHIFTTLDEEYPLAARDKNPPLWLPLRDETELAAACEGLDLSFVLDPSATGPVAADWDVHVHVESQSESIEAESLEVSIVEA